MNNTMLSVGDILRREREKKGLTFQQVEKGTKIRARYIQAVEENNLEEFTSKVYISGVIRNYAKFLGMDVKKAEAYFRRDYEKKEVLKFKKNEVQKYVTPVSIIAPTKTVFRNIDRIRIQGLTEKEASITIFGERVYPNKDGQFQYDLPLKKGKNELVVEVVGGNGKKAMLKKEFVLE
jgi:transcriptional regulator with XRE-family HTH domain